MPTNKTFKTSDGVFDIPESEASAFLTDNPKAVEVKSFVAGKDTFDIPIADVDAFLADNPHVAPVGEKKNTGANSQKPSSTSGGSSTIPPLSAATVKSQINAGTDNALDKAPVAKVEPVKPATQMYEDQAAGFDPHANEQAKAASDKLLADYKQKSIGIGDDMKNIDALAYNIDMKAKDAETSFNTKFQFSKTKSSLADLSAATTAVSSIDDQIHKIVDPEGKAPAENPEKYYQEKYGALPAPQKEALSKLQAQRDEAYKKYEEISSDPVIKKNAEAFKSQAQSLSELKDQYTKSINQYKSDLDYMTGNADAVSQLGMKKTKTQMLDPTTGAYKEMEIAKEDEPLVLWDSNRTAKDNLIGMKNALFQGWGQGMAGAMKRMDAVSHWLENAGTVDYDGKKHKLLGTSGGAFAHVGKLIAGGAEQIAQEAANDPKTIMTATASAAGGLAPMMLEMTLTPEIGAGKIIVPKLVTYMGYTSMADKYNERMDELAKNGFSNYNDLPDNVKWSLKKDGIENFATGAGEGLLLHALTLGSMRYGGAIIPGAYGKAVGGSLASGASFAGYEWAKSKIQNKELDDKDLIASFLMGTALPAVEAIKGEKPASPDEIRTGLQAVADEKTDQYYKILDAVKKGEKTNLELDAIQTLKEQAEKNLADFDQHSPKGVFDMRRLIDKYQINQDIQGLKNFVNDGFQVKATPEEMAMMKKIFTEDQDLFYRAGVSKGVMTDEQEAEFKAKAADVFGPQNVRLLDVLSNMNGRQRALMLAKMFLDQPSEFKTTLGEKIAHVLSGKSLQDIYGFNINAEGENPERTFWASQRETVRSGLGIQGDPADWKEQAQDARAQAETTENPTDAQDLRLRANFLENLGNIHKTAKAIARDPEAYIQQIKDDDTLTPEQKDLFYKMIDDAIEHKGALSTQAGTIAKDIQGMQSDLANIDKSLPEVQQKVLREHIEGKIETATKELTKLYASQKSAKEVAAEMKPATPQLEDDEVLSAWVKSDPELSREHEAITQLENPELRKTALEVFQEKAKALMPDDFEKQFVQEKKEAKAKKTAKVKAEKPKTEAEETPADEAIEPVQEKSELPAEETRKAVEKKVEESGLKGPNVHVVRPATETKTVKAPKKNAKIDESKLDLSFLDIKEAEAEYKKGEEYVPSADRIAKAQKTISAYTSMGVHDFNSIAEDIFARAGEKFDKDAFTALKGAYAQYATIAPDDVHEKMTTTPELRKLNHEDFINQYKNQEDDNTRLPDTERENAPAMDDGVRTGGTEKAIQGGETSGVPDTDSGEGGSAPTTTGKPRKKPVRSAGSSKRNDTSASTGGGTGDDAGGGAAADRGQPTRRVEDLNHSIAPEDEIVPVGEVAKVKANLEAIKLVQKLEAEDRNATPEEKKTLAKFTGWGGLAKQLSPGGRFYNEISALLTKDQLRDAVNSTINAHYTARPYINAMWDIARQLGFKGGNFIEPSSGAGHIIGLMPKDLADKTNTVAYELDDVTGKIAKKLYPESVVNVKGFEHSTEANNSQDLTMSNVPFGKAGLVYDKNYPELSKFSLHNYFIAKNLQLLKPGGVGIFITSSSTMDNASSAKFRRWVTNEGNSDFIGAIRLPNNAFKENAGTEVTTDILLFRKRDAENPVAEAEPFQYTQTIRGVEMGGEQVPINVNEYYDRHPEQMLGRMVIADEVGGGMYSGKTQTLEPNPGQDTQALLKEAIERLPKDVVGAQAADKKTSIEQSESTDKDGSIKEKDGKIYQVDGSELKPVDWQAESVKIGSKTFKKADIAKDYLNLKEAAKNILALEQSESATDQEIEAARKNLNELYDGMAKNYRSFNDNPKLDFLQDDVEYNMVYALENVKRIPYLTANNAVRNKMEITKADIFKTRTNFPVQEPTTASDPLDAVNISMSYRNNIDLPYVASMLGVSEEEAKNTLLSQGVAFENPQTGLLDPRDNYLSGFVRLKLKEAEKAAKTDPKFESNVEALKNVIPKDIPAPLIKKKLSATWIPGKMVEQFAKDLLGVDMRIRYSDATKSWIVGDPSNKNNARNTTTYGTARYDGHDLLDAALNLRQPEVFDYNWVDGKKVAVRNPTETAAAQAKMEEIIDAFENYMTEHSEFHPELEKIYNEKYNGYVEKKFSQPPFKYYPGAAKIYLDSAGNEQPLYLKIHQSKGVQRAISDSALLAHSVGTGKTYAMITVAMEWRRLGIAKKPMMVVHNSTVDQFAASFKVLYPQAKILVPTKKDMTAEHRQRLFNKIAFGDWDAVIIPQSFVDFIPDDPQREKDYLAEQIDQINDALAGAEGDKATTRELERKKTKLEEQYEAVGITAPKKGARKVKDEARSNLSTIEKFEAQRDRRKDDVLNFENMGVDGLIVDEAHAYKKLGLITRMNRVKGIDVGSSKRAFGMYMKTRFIQEKNKGKNVVFATGTPITNTMAEMWTMMRYVAPDVLDKYGLNTFDEFASNFGAIEPSLEFTASGQFRSVQRFKSFVNVPELLQAWRAKTDVVLTEDVPEFKEGNDIPKLKVQPDGKPAYTSVIIPQSPMLEKIMADLKQILIDWEKLPSAEKKEKRHIPLVVFNRAKQAAIDPRLLKASFPDDPMSKTNKVVEKILEKYHATTPYKGTQLILSDMFQSPERETTITDVSAESMIENENNTNRVAPVKTKRFNLFEDMKAKLIAAGVPADEILIIPEDKEKRSLYYPDINSGKIRIVFGTTERIAVGTNIQTLMAGLHHMDAPPRPMDFEQRNGRIIRQGNMHAKMNLPIEVFTHGVEKTADAAAYGRLTFKQKFINQIMKGDTGGERNPGDPAEEDSANDLSFGQMMATLSGSQFAIKQQHMEGELRKLENAKKNHEQNIIHANHRLQDEKKVLAEIKTWKPDIDKLYESVSDKFDDKDTINSVEVDGTKYTETPSKPLQQAIGDLIDKAAKKGTDQQQVVKINDVPVLLKTVEHVYTDSGNEMGDDAKNLVRTGFIKGEFKRTYGVKYSVIGTGHYAEYFGKEVSTGTGLIDSVKSAIENIRKEHDQFPERVSRKEQDIKTYQDEIQKPFAKNDRITELQSELADIEQKMQEEFATPEEKEKMANAIAPATPEEAKEHIDIAYGSEDIMKSSIEEVTGEMDALPDFGSITYTDEKGKEHEIKSSSIKEDLRNFNFADVIGRTVSMPGDLAEAFIGARNPKMEVAITAFQDKTGKILHVSAQTLGLPWMGRVASIEDMADIAKRVGATHVSLLHNHPSGEHQPSAQDIAMTKQIAEKLSEKGLILVGHVVIDHTKFSFINPKGEHKAYDLNTPQPEQHHERYALPKGGKGDAPQVMARIASQLINQKGYDAAIVYVSPGLKINGFEPVESADIEKGELTPELYKKIEANLLKYGASQYAIVHNGLDVHGKVPARLLDVIDTKNGNGEDGPTRGRVDEAPEMSPDIRTLFDTQEDYDKREQAKEDLKNAMAAIQLPSLGDKIKNSNALQMAKDLVQSFHPFAIDKNGFARDASIIIRNRAGLENAQIAQQQKAYDKLMDFWNSVPKLQRRGFILSYQNSEKYGSISNEVNLYGMKQHLPIDTEHLRDIYKKQYDDLYKIVSKWHDIPMLEDFFAQFWKDPSEAKKVFGQSKTPLEGPKEFLKRRFYSDWLEGIKAGLEPVSDNPEEMLRMKQATVWQMDKAESIFLDLHKAGMLKFYKAGAKVGSEKGEIPEGWVTVEDPIFKRMMVFNIPIKNESGEIEQKPKVSRGDYYMPKEVAKVINNYLSIGIFNKKGTIGNLSNVVRTFNNIKNGIQLGLGFYHYTYTMIDASASELANGLVSLSTLTPKNVGIGLLQVGAAATIVPSVAGTLWRGNKAIRDLKLGNVNNADVQALINANANTGLTTMYSLDAQYRFKKAIMLAITDREFSHGLFDGFKIPDALGHTGTAIKTLIPAILEAANYPIMGWLVPRLKAGMYLKTLDNEIRANLNMTERELAIKKLEVWDSMDDRLGEVVYDNNFWNKSFKDILFMSLRSFGWSGGTVKAIGKGVSDIPKSAIGMGESVGGVTQGLIGGKLGDWDILDYGNKALGTEQGRKGISNRLAYLLALPMLVGWIGGLLMYMLTGERPKKMKDYFYPKTGNKEADGVTDERITLPTITKDIISYSDAPLSTATHKISPFLSEIWDLSNNKDFYNTQIYNPDDTKFQKGKELLNYELQSLVPFSFKSTKEDQRSFDEKIATKEGLLKLFGMMPAHKDIEREGVQNEIIKEAAKKYQGLIKTKEDADKQEARNNLHHYIFNGGNIEEVDEIYNGKTVGDWVIQAKIKDSSRFIKESQMNPYERSFKSLEQEVQERIFHTMTPMEKTQYAPYVLPDMSKDDRMEYFKSVLGDLDKADKEAKILQLRQQKVFLSSDEEEILLK